MPIPAGGGATSEGSREFDRLVDSRLTFREKLEWLEQAETIVLTLRASRERWKQGSAPPAEL